MPASLPEEKTRRRRENAPRGASPEREDPGRRQGAAPPEGSAAWSVYCFRLHQPGEAGALLRCRGRRPDTALSTALIEEPALLFDGYREAGQAQGRPVGPGTDSHQHERALQGVVIDFQRRGAPPPLVITRPDEDRPARFRVAVHHGTPPHGVTTIWAYRTRCDG